MGNLIDVLFKLIRSAIGFDEKFSQEDHVLIKEKLKTLYELSRKHDIAHLVGFAIISNDIIDKETFLEFYNKFNQSQILAVYRGEKNSYVFDEISKTLEDYGIEFVPLKGAVLRKYYPQKWMRTSCDIDILVHNEDIERASDLLCLNSNCIKEKNSTFHDCALTFDDVHLELHYTLRQDGKLPKTDKILDNIWKFSSNKNGCLYEKELSNEAFMFYHLAHMAKHFLIGGCGVRSFIDLQVMFQKMEFANDSLIEMLKESDLYTFYQSVLNLSSVWFNKKEHSELTKSMEKFVLTGGVYGTTRNSVAVKSGKGESKAKSLLNIIFLNRERLEIIYPNLKKHPSLFLFYQVKRWFNIFNKGKRKKLQNIIKANNEVDKNEIKSVGDMIEKLGL